MTLPGPPERDAAVVNALCNVDPLYDYSTCFFCSAAAPSPGDKREHVARGEDHADDCAWWMARQLRGLPAWP